MKYPEFTVYFPEVLTKNFTETDGTPLPFRSFQESVQSVLNNAKDWTEKATPERNNRFVQQINFI